MTSVAAALMSAIILTTVFTVMWRNHRERWIGLWAVAAALWTLRYVIAIVMSEYRYQPGAHLLPTIALARAFFLLCGSYALSERRLPSAWVAVFAGDAAVLAAEVLWGDVPIAGAYAVTHYVVFSAATIWSAALVLRERVVLRGEAWVLATGLATMGFANLTFPWASLQPAISAQLFITVHAAQLLIGFGAMMMFYRRMARERDLANFDLRETNDQLASSNSMLAAALEKALSGYLPICAHCKAIQNPQGQWEPLERYFMSRHDTAFSHGICEPCEEIHYGELLRAP